MNIIYFTLCLCLLVAGLVLATLGVRAHVNAAARNGAIVLRYNKTQRWVTLLICAPLFMYIATLPLSEMPIDDPFDLVLVLLILASLLLLLLETNSRAVALSSDGGEIVNWRGASTKFMWTEVRHIRFYNIFGGFFVLGGVFGRTFIPVQIERPLSIINALEKNVAADVMRGAEEGMKMCRSHFSRL